MRRLVWVWLLLAVGAPARGQTPPPAIGVNPTGAATPGHAARGGRLVGRVMERGSTATPIAGADVTAGDATVVTDDDGRFTVDAPAGEIDVVITAPRYEALRAREAIVAGTGLSVEYRLTPDVAHRSRYQSVVRGEARHEGQRFTLEDENLHQLPGTLGDPFRVVGTLPGVVQPITLLPYYVVRGASPGMNGFFLDGMRVPQLFHFLVGGGVVHPGLVDRLDFYPGTYDVSFGRYAGGVIDAATRAGRSDAPFHGEAELRVYDASAYAEVRGPTIAGAPVTVEAAGHYGYPSLIIGYVEPGVGVTYWDYQLRADWKGLTLEALGSYDSVVLPASLFPPHSFLGNANDNYYTQFHRVQLRDILRRGRAELELAIVGGIDDMALFGGEGVEKLGLSARAIGRLGLGPLALKAGLDGEISRFRARNFDTLLTDTGNGLAPDALGDLAGNRDGIVAGTYAEGTLRLDRWLHRPATVNAGVRFDEYHAGPATLLGIDPRLIAKYSPIDLLEIDAGVGYYQQPPSFPVALPGLDTFALQLGLQHALQWSTTVQANLPSKTAFSLTGYYSKFSNINDVVIDPGPQLCTSTPPPSLEGIPAIITRQLDGAAYGMELLLRKQAGIVTGWIAYTLARSERNYICGLRPSDFDQTHVLNIVVQAHLPWQLLAGGRFYLTTGRPYTQVSVDEGAVLPSVRNNQRLPTFFQLDLRVDREWRFEKWTLAAFVEVLNLTYSESYIGVQYPPRMIQGVTVTDYSNPLLYGFQWVLPSIGVRGRI